MMYVEFMKNFLLAYSSEQMAVRLISVSWAEKRLIPSFWTWCTSSLWKIFFSPIRPSYGLLDSFYPPDPKNVSFLLPRHDVRPVQENIFSRAPIRGTDGYWSHFGLLSPKTFDSYFLHLMYFEFMKIFFSPIRASYWLLDSFWPAELKNVWFLLSRHDVRLFHEKFPSRRFERAIGC